LLRNLKTTIMQIAFLVTAHVPYVRRAARTAVGEDQLHHTIAEGLIPLINILWELQQSRLQPHIALACSPILLEQLADPLVQNHFALWMQQWLENATQATVRWERESLAHQAYLARFFLEWGSQIFSSFEQRFSRDLVAELQTLCAMGVIEPIAGVATHAYMPLLRHQGSLRSQIELGVASTSQRLRRARGIWLPDSGVRPELPSFLQSAGMRYLIVDPSTLEYEHDQSGKIVPEPAWLIDHRLAALPLDMQAGVHIWSEELGYRGDPLYRDARRDVQSGLPYWARGSQGAAPYDPYHAYRQAQEHASHFVSVLNRIAESGVESMLLPIDLQLIGSDWFEGMIWLRSVLMQCSHHPRLRLSTPRQILRHQAPKGRARLRSASWSADTSHYAWQGQLTKRYWQELYEAEERFSQLIAQEEQGNEFHDRILNQALRELLLAQASDWPALLSAGIEETEAVSRWRTHLRRFSIMVDLFKLPKLGYAEQMMLEQIEDQDNPFPNLNYRVYET
jgi:1,4-alpha-glucan branching enzyme